MSVHGDFDAVLNSLFLEALAARDEALPVAEQTVKLEKAIDRLIVSSLSKATHPRTTERTTALRALHESASASMTRFIKDALDAMTGAQQHSAQAQVSEIGSALNIAGPGALSDPVVKARLLGAFAELPAFLQTHKFFTAVVAMQLTSTLEAHNETYRMALDVNELPQEFLAASKRLFKAGASDAIGIFIPVTGTLSELFKIGKETWRPELTFNPAMASEQDRLNTFEDNLQRLLKVIAHASALAGQARSAFAKANADFNRSTVEILQLLRPASAEGPNVPSNQA